MSLLRLVVYGTPGPQGSKSFKGMSKAGHAIMVESSSKVKTWRDDVKAVALEIRRTDSAEPLTGPLSVRMTFTLRKPLSAPKRTRTWPAKYPDLSKLVRATEDALTAAGIWRDDAQVVELVTAKRYPGEGVGALDAPGAVIEIVAIEAGVA